jgi:hypothetical protein
VWTSWRHLIHVPKSDLVTLMLQTWKQLGEVGFDPAHKVTVLIDNRNTHGV